MSLTQAWNQAMSADEYIDQMHENQDRYRENIEKTELGSRERERFGGHGLKILILTEDFCGDSAQFVPPVVKLANELPGVEIRFLLRDGWRDLASNYRRADGYQAIPVIILMDDQLEEIGHLVERPALVSAQMADETRRFVTEHPELEGGQRNIDRMPEETREAVKAHNREWRWTMQEPWTTILFDELAETLDQGRHRDAAD